MTVELAVLATGGFQGSPSMMAKYLGEDGDNVFVRSDQGSVGDALGLAIAVGAGTSSTYSGRGCHLKLQDYLPLAQYRE